MVRDGASSDGKDKARADCRKEQVATDVDALSHRAAHDARSEACQHGGEEDPAGLRVGPARKEDVSGAKERWPLAREQAVAEHKPHHRRYTDV